VWWGGVGGAFASAQEGRAGVPGLHIRSRRPGVEAPGRWLCADGAGAFRAGRVTGNGLGLQFESSEIRAWDAPPIDTRNCASGAPAAECSSRQAVVGGRRASLRPWRSVVVEDVEAGAGRLEAKHRTASATSEGAVARAKSMARLRDSLPKAASSLVLVGAMLLPCSSSAYSSTVLNFAAPPCLAPRAVPATACHLDRQGLFAGRQLLRQSRGLERAGTASRGSARVMRTSGVRNMLAMEPIEEMRDYSEDDALGRRLFVTGLASSIDDVRLYLAFEGFGRIVEAHVAKPVHNGYMLY